VEPGPDRKTAPRIALPVMLDLTAYAFHPSLSSQYQLALTYAFLMTMQVIALRASVYSANGFTLMTLTSMLPVNGQGEKTMSRKPMTQLKLQASDSTCQTAERVIP
jgi:hypothetical protein